MPINTENFLFEVFLVIVALFLFVDLGILHRRAEKLSTRSALYQSIFWIVVSSSFGLFIYLFYDKSGNLSLEFFSAYITEYALSVDNIFVILLILRYFKVGEEYYHNILFWGILGAIFFRAIFIFLGGYIINQFHWILYAFGGLLIYSGIKIFFNEEDHNNQDISKNRIFKWCMKYLPVREGKPGAFIVTKPKFAFTSLFVVIVLIETTDLIFAVDSIPAAFAITRNKFIVYTSNIFAVLGLRTMFFLLSEVIDKFYLLQKGLSIILFFIGSKMILEFFDVYIPVGLSFIIILTVLSSSIIFSILIPRNKS